MARRATVDVLAAIRTELSRRRWTQRQLAEVAGVSESTLSRWLAGVREPGVGQIGTVLAALGLRVRRGRPPRR